MELRVGPTEWYETLRFADGVTLIHEPWIKSFYRCNIWHVRGRDRDLLPAVNDGRLVPVIDRVFPFDEVPAAARHMDANAHLGKIVVKVV